MHSNALVSIAKWYINHLERNKFASGYQSPDSTVEIELIGICLKTVFQKRSNVKCFIDRNECKFYVLFHSMPDYVSNQQHNSHDATYKIPFFVFQINLKILSATFEEFYREISH